MTIFVLSLKFQYLWHHPHRKTMTLMIYQKVLELFTSSSELEWRQLGMIC